MTEQHNPANRLLTIPEARELVGEKKLSRYQAYLFAKRHGFLLGRKLVVPLSKLEALLEGQLPPEGGSSR